MFQLSDPISRSFNMRFPALRAATRPGKTFPLFKNIPAFQAPGRLDDERFSLRGHRECNMGEMLIDLLFSDSHIPRKIDRGDFPFTQNFNKLLSNRFHFSFVKQATVFRDHTRLMTCNQEKVQNFTRVLDDLFFL